jgi:ABC-type transport system substrate-binding protein
VLTRINVGNDTTAARIPVGGGPVALAAAGSDIWVAAGAAAGAKPVGGTLRVVTVYPPTSIDPALIYPQMQAQFSAATYDTLVTFQKTGGATGLQLVPDLALAMPTVSADGTVYTFTLRPGLRYSTGQPVRPQDFRYALERVLDLNQTASSFLDGSQARPRAHPGGAVTWMRASRSTTPPTRSRSAWSRLTRISWTSWRSNSLLRCRRTCRCTIPAACQCPAQART